MSKYIAWNGDHDLKQRTVAQMRQHREAGRLIQNVYFAITANGAWRGCNIGCLAQSDNHADVAELLNCPLQIPYLMDVIFECLPIDAARAWAVDNIEAIPVGADLTHVWPRIAVWLLTDAQYGAMQYAKSEQVRNAIQSVIDLYQRAIDENSEVDIKTADALAYAARAADAARAVARASHVRFFTIYAVSYPDDVAYAARTVARTAARTAEAADFWFALRDKTLDVLRNAPRIR